MAINFKSKQFALPTEPKSALAIAAKSACEQIGSLPKLSRESIATHEATDLSCDTSLTTVLSPATSVASTGMQDARRTLAAFVESGTADSSLLDVIYDGEGFLPIEGLLLDYKREIPADKFGMSKFLKHVLAFHNTYGGFLVIGADEKLKDSQIIPAWTEAISVDTKQLRDLCREFFSAPIELQSRTVNGRFDNKQFAIEVIHIPKRASKEPVLVKRDSARDSAGNTAFLRDEVYLREGDNSIRATTVYHWRLLYGERTNPYLTDYEIAFASREPIWDDLPDRGFICQDFVGREDLLSHLFSWLADDFSCVRVLAGEGGLGKTSTAYQFATEVAKSRLIEIQNVVWVTAKRQQFRAMLNSYEEVAHRHFSSSAELFAVLASNLGDIRVNWADVTETEFPKILRDLALHIKVFFVIDDLELIRK